MQVKLFCTPVTDHTFKGRHIMAGVNKQGSGGKGAQAGRQYGMCRRTDELSFERRKGGQGQGLGGRCCDAYLQTPEGQLDSVINTATGFTQGDAEELASLKAEYQKTQSMLKALVQKIEVMEGAIESPKAIENNEQR
ncbi:MAG: hypothetical protein COA36_09275 [Desulfotalea sp.]|nr:MAG: hypothetical protein COA36_09275 [Desulfotalea sp.]